MFKTFKIDLSLAEEAVLQGRQLIVEVSDTHHIVRLGPPPKVKVTQGVGLKKRA